MAFSLSLWCENCHQHICLGCENKDEHLDLNHSTHPFNSLVGVKSAAACLMEHQREIQRHVVPVCQSLEKMLVAYMDKGNYGERLLGSTGLTTSDATRPGGLSVTEAMTVYNQTLNMLGEANEGAEKLNEPLSLVREAAIALLLDDGAWKDFSPPEHNHGIKPTTPSNTSFRGESSPSLAERLETSSLPANEETYIPVHPECDETERHEVGIFGGQGCENILRYWRSSSGQEYHGRELNPPRIACTATRLPSGNILLCGGYDPASALDLNNCQLVSPRYGYSMVGNPLPLARSHHCVAAIQDNVFIFGGKKEYRVSDSIFRWSESSYQWSEIATLLEPKQDAEAVAYGDSVYLIGGQSRNPSTSCFLYTPGANRVSVWWRIPRKRYGLKAAVMNGRIYATGGLQGVKWNHVFTKDPRSHGSWKCGPDMLVERAFHGVVAKDGKLWALGGDGYGRAGNRSIEVLDPRMNRWEKLSITLNNPCEHAAVIAL